jgi:hypothetical protein
MKVLKVAGLAVVFGSVAMLLFGVSGASAETTLCTVTPNKWTSTNCPAGPYTGELNAELETFQEATLTPAGELPEISCKKSSLKGKVETATTPSGKLESLTFSECNQSVEVLASGSVTVHHDADHNGNFTLTGFKIRIKTAGLTCTFGENVSTGLTLTGGNPSTVRATATIPLKEGFFCPSSAVFHAVYKLKTPELLYVGTGTAGTSICTETPSGEAGKCPTGSGYTGEVDAQLSASTNAVLTAGGGLVEIVCSGSTVKGKAESATTPYGSLEALTFEECNNTVEVLRRGALAIRYDAEHNANLVAREFEVRVKASGLTCTFGEEVSAGLTFTGGKPATVTATATVPLLTGFFCPKSAVWHATYSLNTPSALYAGTGT